LHGLCFFVMENIPTALFGTWLRRLVALIAALCASAAVQAQPVRTDFVEAELVPEYLAWVPGQQAWVALRLKHEPHWHTYWRNPGDAGVPTRVQWTLPEGFAAGPIEWPVPHRIPVPPLANYGYEGEVLLLVPIDVPNRMFFGDVTLRAHVDWLVCKDVCIPGGADLKLKLPVVQGSPAINDRYTDAFAATRAALPREIAGLHATATGHGKSIDLAIPLAGSKGSLAGSKESPAGSAGSPASTAAPGKVYFFSGVAGLVEPSAPQPANVQDGVLHVRLPVASQLTATGNLIDGVLVSDPPIVAGAAGVALTTMFDGAIVAGDPVQLPEEGGAAGAASDGRSLTLALALLFALAGGLMLNLMPCVFPVISIKILGFAERAHGDKSVLRAQGLGFAAGVIVSFAVFAAAILALRESGAALGWGFQLQSPAVVLGLAALFMLLGLNLFGVFEVLLPAPALSDERGNLHPGASAFMGGILAALIASPCTAPFMGAALGFALTQSVPAALLVFVALGVGMALPYIVLSWFPALLKRLPRPGPWLLRLKEALAFPLFGTVIWLLWVLAQQIGVDGAARGAAGLLAFACAAWLWGHAQRGSAVWVRVCGAIALALGIAVAASGLREAPDGSSDRAQATMWRPFSAQSLADLQAQGQPVFVDFTAAWCVTCQVNKKLVLERPATEREFAERSVVLMRADWTRRDEAISDALHALGRNGVPVYALYRPGSAPLLLPEVLQEQNIRDALATLPVAAPVKAASR
jgi:thiol:disulfide interchange protein/DsbC/DsbD-like thiol-disulfide interchange protein